MYFSPECHSEYEALGFGPSPGEFGAGVKAPDGPAYFCSRGSVMGQVPGELIAAAFAVFNPAVVVPAVSYGWTLTDAVTIEAARTRGALGQLSRILGERPEGIDRAGELLARASNALRPAGRPLFAGLLSQSLPGEPLGDAWRWADRLREARGDAHTAAWTSAGFWGPEIGLLTELWWGLPMRTYLRTRAWSSDEVDAAEERLRSDGLVDDGELTAAGREAREKIEAATDCQMRAAIEALGDELDEAARTARALERRHPCRKRLPAYGSPRPRRRRIAKLIRLAWPRLLPWGGSRTGGRLPRLRGGCLRTTGGCLRCP